MFRDLKLGFLDRISNLGQTGEYDTANPGYNTALLDIYHIRCLRWQDPNQHAITKYIFKGEFLLQTCKMCLNFFSAVEEVQDGYKSRLLYAGPLDNAKVIFGVGRFKLNAEVIMVQTLIATKIQKNNLNRRSGTKPELSPPMKFTPASPP